MRQKKTGPFTAEQYNKAISNCGFLTAGLITGTLTAVLGSKAGYEPVIQAEKEYIATEIEELHRLEKLEKTGQTNENIKFNVTYINEHAKFDSTQYRQVPISALKTNCVQNITTAQKRMGIDEFIDHTVLFCGGMLPAMFLAMPLLLFEKKAERKIKQVAEFLENKQNTVVMPFIRNVFSGPKPE